MRQLALFFALVGVLALVACGGAPDSEPAAEDHAASTPAEHVQPEATEAVAASYAIGDKVELTGVAGCGHCSYHTTDSCAMAMQVGDVVFILDGIDEDTEAFNQRTSGKEIQIVGTITDAGDPMHISVESHEM